MVLTECACGFSCGTETAFQKHLQRYPGSREHGRLEEAGGRGPAALRPGGSAWVPTAAGGLGEGRNYAAPEECGWRRPPYREEEAGATWRELRQFLEPCPGPPVEPATSPAAPRQRWPPEGTPEPGEEEGWGGEAEEAASAAPPLRPPRAARALSLLSEEAIAGLHRSAAELAGLEGCVEEVAFQLDCRVVTPSQARTELCQLETQAKQLECKGVDAVITSELGTGRAQAKTEKKEQLARLEALFERLEALFKKIRAMEAGGC